MLLGDSFIVIAFGFTRFSLAPWFTTKRFPSFNARHLGKPRLVTEGTANEVPQTSPCLLRCRSSGGRRDPM